MCRCAERRGALVRSAGAMARGDLTGVRREAGYVTRTLAEDAAAAARRIAQSTAKLRLLSGKPR